MNTEANMSSLPNKLLLSSNMMKDDGFKHLIKPIANHKRI